MDNESTEIDRPPMPQNKAELMERIYRSWAALEQTINQLSDVQMTTPGSNGGWAVKDHMAHLTTWEQRLLAFLQGHPYLYVIHEVFHMDKESYKRAIDESGLDGLNAIIYQRTKGRSLTEVRAAFQQSHRQVLASLEGLTEADLRKLQLADDPAAVPPVNAWADRVIVGNTYEHYLFHKASIQRLTEQHKQSGEHTPSPARSG